MPGLRLQGEISLDGSGWTSGLNRAKSESSAFSSSLGGIKNAIAGAFTVGAVVSFGKHVIDTAGQISDLSARLGVSTDYLQEMQFVMKANGGSVEDLTAAFEKLGAARVDALAGDEKKLATFQQFGISATNLQTATAQEIVDQIASQFKKFGRSDALVSAFKNLGGKGAGALVPAFIDGLEEGRQKAQDAGAVISSETIQALDLAGDEFSALSQILTTMVAPAVEMVASLMLRATGDLYAFQQGLANFFTQIIANKDSLDVRGQVSSQREAAFKKLSEDYKSGKFGTGEAADKEYDRRFARLKSIFDKAQEGLGELPTFTEGVMDADKFIAALKQSFSSKATADNFIPYTPKEKKSAKENRYSDSLLAVGNFLGAGAGSTISDISQKQLQAQNLANTYLKIIATVVGAQTGGIINVPQS